MRTLLVCTGLCLTAGTFFAAERLTSSNDAKVALQQQSLTEAALAEHKAHFAAEVAEEMAALEGSKAKAEERVALLTRSLEDITSERDALQGEITTAEAEAEAIRTKLTELETANAALMADVKAKEATLGTTAAEVDALTAQIETLSAEASDSAVATPAPEMAALEAEIATLSESLAEREETISTLQAQIDASLAAVADASEGESDVATAALTEELALANQTIEDLTGAVATSEAELAALTETLTERDTAVADLQAQVAELEAAAEATPPVVAVDETAPEDGSPLSAQVAELTQLVASQTETISHLRMGFETKPDSPMEMASACIERANKIFEVSQIQFGTGNSSITEQSTTTLDHLRDLAIGCESDEMIIEIGGHTDSLGAESANQRLSEARANSVRDFLIARGIPEDTMIAVGFGETQPIASNDTLEGRALNRRITFTWQMREDDEAAAADIAPEADVTPAADITDAADVTPENVDG